MTFKEEAQKILEDATKECSRNSVIAVTDRYANPTHAMERNIEVVETALTSIINLVDKDIIGEDEYMLSLVALLDEATTTEDLDRERAKQAQNALKAEQRNKLKEEAIKYLEAKKD